MILTYTIFIIKSFLLNTIDIFKDILNVNVCEHKRNFNFLYL